MVALGECRPFVSDISSPRKIILDDLGYHLVVGSHQSPEIVTECGIIVFGYDEGPAFI